MAKITKRSVEALSPAKNGPSFLWDDTLAGFGVKALPSGPKRYIVKYRALGGGRSAPQRWLTLGSHGQITPDQARSMAQQALAAVARGEDPQQDKQKRKVAPTLKDAWDRFEHEHLPTKKPHTQYDYRNIWNGKLGPLFAKVKVEALSRGEVNKFHISMRNTPYQANRALAVLARLMSLTELWEWRAQRTNPCEGIKRFKEEPRNRYLTLAEITTMNNAAKELVAENEIGLTAAHAIELLLLTGARKNEVLSARWDWLDRKRQVLSLPDSKTGAKPVYLSEAALAVLDRQHTVSHASVYIFPSRDEGKHFVGLPKSWAKICQRAGLQGVRLHDLRHTAASIAVGQGASLPLVGKLLGHTQAQTTQRYAHVDIDPALRAANEIGSVVAEALKGAEED